MTNFEKWKEGLTAERVFFDDYDENFFTPAPNEFLGGEQCLQDWFNSPAEESKPENKPESKPLTSTMVWHKWPDKKPPRSQEFYLVRTKYQTTTQLWMGGWNLIEPSLITHLAELPEPPKEG